MNPPFVHAIVLRETPDRTERLRKHLSEEGIYWNPFYGVNAEKWGLTTVHPYEVDSPGSGYIMIQKHVGLHLSHYWLWRCAYDALFHQRAAILNLTDCETKTRDECSVTILEDDALFLPGWEPRLDKALNDVPKDWEILMIGSCNCEGHDTEHIKGEIFKVKYPQCTHAMIIKERALPILIETQEKSWAPIDLALIFNSYPLLNVYTVLPRIVDQYGQEICK